MAYRVVLIESEEGFAIGCPSLPGCWSQGGTEKEAVENIREAMLLWLDAGGVPLYHEAEQIAWSEILNDANRDRLRTQIREVGLPVAA